MTFHWLLAVHHIQIDDDRLQTCTLADCVSVTTVADRPIRRLRLVVPPITNTGLARSNFVHMCTRLLQIIVTRAKKHTFTACTPTKLLLVHSRYSMIANYDVFTSLQHVLLFSFNARTNPPLSWTACLLFSGRNLYTLQLTIRVSLFLISRL